jgi:predicted Zn-dependent protease
VVFNVQMQTKNRLQTMAGKYGLAFVALKQGAYAKAESLLQEASAAAQRISPDAASHTAMLAGLAIDIKLAAKQPEAALKEADSAREKFPLSRVIARQYAQALMAAARYDDAVNYLRDQIQLYPQEFQLQDQLAQTYAAQGKQVLQHLALAESYVLTGSVPGALEQLNIARKAPDASFYDLALIDARERELQTRWHDEMKEKKNR